MQLPDVFQRVRHSLSEIVLSRRIGLLALYGGLFVTGAALILGSSPFGVGVTHDSVFYLTAAENLTEGRGLSWFGDGGVLRPLTHFAPLYPFTLALVIRFGLSPEGAARWIAALAFGGIVALIGLLTWRYSRRMWAGLVASGIAMVSATILGVHVIALSEPLFILLVLACLSALAKHGAHPSRWSLVLAALLAGLSYLARYVGVVVVGTGILCLLLLGERKILDRIREAVLFGVIALAPNALWLTRNINLTGTATNRTFGFHPPQRVALEKLVETLVGWFSPIEVAPTWAYVLMFTLGLGVVLGYRRLCTRQDSGTRATCNLMLASMMFSVVYIVSLWISLTFFDASTPIDNRILSPLYPVALIMFVLLASLVRIPSKLMVPWGILFVVIGGVLALNQGQAAYRTLRSLYTSGIGFSSESWRNSDTIAWVEDLPASARIYTNERLALTYLTGKPAFAIPEKYDSVKAQIRSEFEQEFGAMQANLKEPHSYLVLFNPYHLRWGLPTRDEITFPLAALERFDDATIYINPVNLD